MKAWRLHSYGGPECMQLDDVPIPTPGPSQVLVLVSKVPVNPFDWKIREGYVKDHRPLDLPTILGVDFVGTVVTLGEDVTRFNVGERVVAMTSALGAHAEYIAVEEDTLARIPNALDDISAATLPLPALSAWQSLYAAGEPWAGMTILIHGASGITGSFAIQLAKAKGATIIGTASAKHREYVMGLGADEFIDYKTENFEDRVRDVDLVLDYVLVGGDSNTTDRSFSVLKSGGALVSLSDPTVMFKTPGHLRGFFPIVGPDATVLEDMAQRLADGKITSKVARVFKRDELVKAMEINKAGGNVGRLIVDFKARS